MLTLIGRKCNLINTYTSCTLVMQIQLFMQKSHKLVIILEGHGNVKLRIPNLSNHMSAMWPVFAKENLYSWFYCLVWWYVVWELCVKKDFRNNVIICFWSNVSCLIFFKKIQTLQGNHEQPVQSSKIGLGRREYQSLQHRHHSQRSKCRPPKGMYLTQEDVVAVSCSPNAANTLLRQLDMELISLKRQVF